jgi:hypothetical protein
LESIGERCFLGCTALQGTDLAATRLRKLDGMAFGWSAVVRVSVPASLREMGLGEFIDTPLKLLDLSACAGIRVGPQAGAQSMDLTLPREGFAEAAKAFALFTVVNVFRADVDQADVNEILPLYDEWGVDRLQVVSPRIGVSEWHRAQQPVVVELTEPVVVTSPAAVTMTAWRPAPVEWKHCLRTIDLSGVVLDLLPVGSSLRGCRLLERAVLPARLRVLPRDFFYGCVRLKSIVAGVTTLEEIRVSACGRCRSLAAFPFPPTLRKLEAPFLGTSIAMMDLSGTAAESVEILGMVFLAELILPRRCVLVQVSGVPLLRCVTFGASRTGADFAWHPTEVRFESLIASADFSRGLTEARVYGEVACQLGRETVPFPPP